MPNEIENMPHGTGAFESAFDPRTVKARDLAVMPESPLVSGGFDYLPDDILDQYRVGICTAISLVQNRNKANHKKYSYDFQYLLQKKFFDLGWYEGSSIFNALRVGKNFGFLPAELWTHTTKEDLKLPYDQYSAKLQSVSDEEITRLLSLCVDKIPGYAQVDITDLQSIAHAIKNSEAGIICRYGCQKNWWTSPAGVPSNDPKDINPLRYAPETSGHAIVMPKFDYSLANMQVLANTWGVDWCKKGLADINWDNYKMNDTWVVLRTTPAITYPVVRLGQVNDNVGQIQRILNEKMKAGLIVDKNFGQKTLKALKNFQSLNHLVVDGVCGKMTWKALLAK